MRSGLMYAVRGFQVFRWQEVLGVKARESSELGARMRSFMVKCFVTWSKRVVLVEAVV